MEYQSTSFPEGSRHTLFIAPIKFTNTPFNGDYGDKNRAKKLYSFLLKSQLFPKEKNQNQTNKNKKN